MMGTRGIFIARYLLIMLGPPCKGRVFLFAPVCYDGGMIDQKLLLTLPYEMLDEDDMKECGIELRQNLNDSSGTGAIKSSFGGDFVDKLTAIMGEPSGSRSGGQSISMEEPAAAVDDVIAGLAAKNRKFKTALSLARYIAGSVRGRRRQLLSQMWKKAGVWLQEGVSVEGTPASDNIAVDEQGHVIGNVGGKTAVRKSDS